MCAGGRGSDEHDLPVGRQHRGRGRDHVYGYLVTVVGVVVACSVGCSRSSSILGRASIVPAVTQGLEVLLAVGHDVGSHLRGIRVRS